MEDTFIVKQTEAGKRIDVIAAKKFPEISRSRWTHYGIFENGGMAQKPKTKLKLGEEWKISCEKEPQLATDLKAWDYPLKILAESDTWVAIEKPYGIAVHPSISDTKQETVINALVHHFGANLSENFDAIEGRLIPRPGLVHRLDKTTSGVLLIAKKNETHRYFQENWSDCRKIYETIVTGKPPLKGRIEGSIFRDPRDRKKMSVVRHEKAKSALTLFETQQTEHGYADLEVQIMTGRTHQIRVHLSSIDFPILGDGLYGGAEADRIYLHASRLTFPNPDQKGALETVTSELPWDFETVVASR